jgi:DNA sulfur modification protein DndC
MGVIADLFLRDEDQTIEQRHCTLPPHKRAIASYKRVLLAGHPCQLQFSSGKDSSCCANLLLTAAIELMAEGHTCPPLHVCHADTTVENPCVRALADGELEKMRVFAAHHKLPLTIHIGQPTLSARYATRIIGGRALPPYPNGKRDCTTDYKISVSERISRHILEELPANGPALVTVIGTRTSESLARQVNTAARKETAHEIWYSPSGQARLSPILDWLDEDVWMYLGEAAAGMHPTYSDFADLMSFYASAGASSCVVVADMKSAANAKACGARGGCWSCSAVTLDRSVHNMIESEPDRYRYLASLMRFRDYVANVQYDWSKRNFLGRTIDEHGDIEVKADQFSPAMCEDLLRYMLAAQAEANALGAPSRVQAIGLRELIAIDFYWSCRAWHKPFHALWIYFDHLAGNVRFAPKLERPVAPSPVPVIGKIHVGDGWDDDGHPMRPSGLRDPLWEMFSESCGRCLRSNAAGKVFLDLDEMPEFDVDEEGASLFLEFEAEEMIERYHRPDIDWTMAATIYLRYGTVSLAKGQSSSIDDIMRRSQWLQRHDLHGHRTAEELAARCTTLASSQVSLFA